MKRDGWVAVVLEVPMEEGPSCGAGVVWSLPEMVGVSRAAAFSRSTNALPQPRVPTPDALTRYFASGGVL